MGKLNSVFNELKINGSFSCAYPNRPNVRPLYIHSVNMVVNMWYLCLCAVFTTIIIHSRFPCMRAPLFGCDIPFLCLFVCLYQLNHLILNKRPPIYPLWNADYISCMHTTWWNGMNNHASLGVFRCTCTTTCKCARELLFYVFVCSVVHVRYVNWIHSHKKSVFNRMALFKHKLIVVQLFSNIEWNLSLFLGKNIIRVKYGISLTVRK